MPGLLTLKTDLKSLKYGNDTPGGGDSGQPYIQTSIDNQSTPLGFLVRDPEVRKLLGNSFSNKL